MIIITVILIKNINIFYKFCFILTPGIQILKKIVLYSCFVIVVEVARLKVHKEDQDWNKKRKYRPIQLLLKIQKVNR